MINTLLCDAPMIERDGKTLDRCFDELSGTERIRYYAKKEVKMPRGGIDRGGVNSGKILDIEELRRLGREYVNGVKGKRIALVGQRKKADGSKEKCAVFVGCNSLLHKKYSWKLLKTFERIDDKSGVGITLTLRCVNHHSVYYDLKKIKKCWNVLRGKLKRKYEGWGGNYFLITEVGEKSYMVHLHVILYGLKFVSHDWLSEEWRKITSDSYIVYCTKEREKKKRSVKTERERAQKRASDYINKYLSKSLKEGGVSVDGILLIWASGMRLWSCSRGLFGWLERFNASIWIPSPDWEWYVYLVSSDLEGWYEVEKTDYG